MTAESGNRTRWLIPFSYVLALIVPITAPIFALALYQEGERRHAIAVVVVAIAWTAALVLFIL